MNKALFIFALLPLAVALAADPPSSTHWIKVDKKDIPIEDLAHSFFFHSSAASPERLKTIISEEGAIRLQPEIAKHSREMKNIGSMAPKMRQTCTNLQRAQNGQEFAAVLFEMDEREHEEARHAARRILSKLDVDDRKALEYYLDTEFREGAGRSRLDWHGMFGSAPVPSDKTNAIVKRVCDGATAAEAVGGT